MNPYLRVALVVLSAVSIALQTTYPHAAWMIPVTAAITAALGALHLVHISTGAEAPAAPTAPLRAVP